MVRMSEDSVFTKIIKGELPSSKIYEDDLTIAIIPLHPIAIGHVLVIPKLQVDEFFDLPEKDYAALMQTVQKIAKHMRQILGVKRVGLQVVGLDVPHAHVHVIGFNTLDEYRQLPDESLAPEFDKMTELTQKLAF
jgi:histidine triad (HIT) family protein